MKSFFELACIISTKLSPPADGDDYDDDCDDYWGLSDKSFDELIQIKQKDAERTSWLPYAFALETLLKNGDVFDPNESDFLEDKTILMATVLSGRSDLVKILVSMGSDVNATTESGESALSYAAKRGIKEIFDYLYPRTKPYLKEGARFLLDEGLKRRRREDNVIIEAFTLAALCGNQGAVQAALERGMDVNLLDSNGESALHKSIREGHLPIVKLLLDASADLESLEEGNGQTPIMTAIKQSTDEVIQELLDRGTSVNSCDKFGSNVLIYAVLYRQSVELVNKLLLLGANSKVENHEGRTALSYAIELENHELINTKEILDIIKILSRISRS